MIQIRKGVHSTKENLTPTTTQAGTIDSEPLLPCMQTTEMHI